MTFEVKKVVAGIFTLALVITFSNQITSARAEEEDAASLFDVAERAAKPFTFTQADLLGFARKDAQQREAILKTIDKKIKDLEDSIKASSAKITPIQEKLKLVKDDLKQAQKNANEDLVKATKEESEKSASLVGKIFNAEELKAAIEKKADSKVTEEEKAIAKKAEDLVAKLKNILEIKTEGTGEVVLKEIDAALKKPETNSEKLTEAKNAIKDSGLNKNAKWDEIDKLADEVEKAKSTLKTTTEWKAMLNDKEDPEAKKAVAFLQKQINELKATKADDVTKKNSFQALRQITDEIDTEIKDNPDKKEEAIVAAALKSNGREDLLPKRKVAEATESENEDGCEGGGRAGMSKKAIEKLTDGKIKQAIDDRVGPIEKGLQALMEQIKGIQGQLTALGAQVTMDAAMLDSQSKNSDGTALCEAQKDPKTAVANLQKMRSDAVTAANGAENDAKSALQSCGTFEVLLANAKDDQSRASAQAQLAACQQSAQSKIKTAGELKGKIAGFDNAISACSAKSSNQIDQNALSAWKQMYDALGQAYMKQAQQNNTTTPVTPVANGPVIQSAPGATLMQTNSNLNNGGMGMVNSMGMRGGSRFGGNGFNGNGFNRNNGGFNNGGSVRIGR